MRIEALERFVAIAAAGVVVIGVVWSWMCDHVDRAAERDAARRRAERARRFEDLQR